MQPAADAVESEPLYQPARPLSRITLFDFKTLDDNVGESPIGTTFERLDPLVSQYDAALEHLGEQEFFSKNLDQLFDDYPFGDSRPSAHPSNGPPER